MILQRSQTSDGSILVSEILSGLSHCLDITEGHPRGHAARSCLIGMRVGGLIGLSQSEQTDLFYALLLKDAGCSSNAARVSQLFGGNDHETKRAVWMRDWRNLREQAAYAFEHVGRGESLYRRLLRAGKLVAAGSRASRELFQIRCDRGAQIASSLGLSDLTASAIRSMDEHWDGGGQPAGLRGADIPILARIVGLAQVAEIFAQDSGVPAALETVRRRSGRWFDPALVEAFSAVAADSAFWRELKVGDESALLSAAEPLQSAIAADDERVDRIAEAFAWVIDAKSSYTADHSRRVAQFSVQAGERLGLTGRSLTRLRRAALLHDIGKLSIPNSILDKPGRLTKAEWVIVRRHPMHTFEILAGVPIFREFAFDASSHHEKLNGRGYHRGLGGAEMNVSARIMAVADIADALLADRPYRKGLPCSAVTRELTDEGARGSLCVDSVSAMNDALGAIAFPSS